LSREDLYVGVLARSGLFPANVATDAKTIWVRYGSQACQALAAPGGDDVRARSVVFEALGKSSSRGFAEPGLADKAVEIVKAAKLHLCP
jgi:hypothetical protein